MGSHSRKEVQEQKRASIITRIRYFIPSRYMALPHESGLTSPPHRSELGSCSYRAVVLRTPVSPYPRTKLRRLVPVKNLRLCCFSVPPCVPIEVGLKETILPISGRAKDGRSHVVF